MYVAWGRIPNSSKVSNIAAVASGTPPIQPSFALIVGNGGNDGGSSWGNIDFYYERNTGLVKAAAFIVSTGYIMDLHYIMIGI